MFFFVFLLFLFVFLGILFKIGRQDSVSDNACFVLGFVSFLFFSWTDFEVRDHHLSEEINKKNMVIKCFLILTSV